LKLYGLSPDFDVNRLDTQYLRNMILQIGKLLNNQYIGGYESEDKTELAKIYVYNFLMAMRHCRQKMMGDDEMALFRLLTRTSRWRYLERRGLLMKKEKQPDLVIEHRTIESYLKENNEMIKKIIEDMDFLVNSMAELMKIEDDEEDEGE